MAKKDVFAGFSEEDEVIQVEDTNKKKEIINENKEFEKEVEAKKEPEKEVEAKKEPEKEVEKTKEEKNDDSKNKEKEGNEEIDFNLKLEDDAPESKEEVKSFNFKDISKDLELILEGEIEEITKETFIEKVKEKIESSKEKFNYQHIPEDVLDVVKFFAEEGGTTADLLSDNDVVLAEVFLNMSPEAKFVRFQSDRLTKVGLSEEQAAERAQELWDQKTEKDQAQAVTEIDQQLLNFKNQAIKEIVTKRKEIVAKEKQKAVQQAQAEKVKMISVVKGMTEFMGMPIPKEVNDKLVRKIENGDMDKVLNTVAAKARVNAYMMELFGKQIKEVQSKILNETSREAYNKGVGKFIEKNHNVKPERREKGQQSEQKKGNFNFIGIDDE